MVTKFITFALLLTVAQANPISGHAAPHTIYSYGVSDPYTGDIKHQHEERVGDHVVGQYSLYESDGTKRTVDYSADDLNGFNAVVRKEPIYAHAAPIVSPTVAKNNVAPTVADAYVATAAAHTYIPSAVVDNYDAPAVVNTYNAPAVVDTYNAPGVVNTYNAPSLVGTYAAPVLTNLNSIGYAGSLGYGYINGHVTPVADYIVPIVNYAYPGTSYAKGYSGYGSVPGLFINANYDTDVDNGN